MQTLFQSLPESAVVPSDDAARPRLLIDWTPWRRQFLGNLRDLLWERAEAPLELTSRPAEFWPDVFVRRPIPFAGLRQSALYHVFLVVAIWGITQTYVAKPRVVPRSPFENAKITYYPVSEYLPPLDTGNQEAPKPQKGEPEYAKQPIVSVPRQPDNSRQTIVTPPDIKLSHDVPLPNIVAWERPAPEIPLDAARGAMLTVPADLREVVPPPVEARGALKSPALLPADVVPPPPSISPERLRNLGLEPSAIEPAPSISRNDITGPNLPTPAVIEPAPSDVRGRKLGELNIASLPVTGQAPVLPVAAQASVPVRTPGSSGYQRGRATPGGGEGEPTPAAPAIAAGGGNGVGQLIALSVKPAVPNGPVTVPEGNRRGVFAATPEGKPGAPGTPDIKSSGTGQGAGNGHAPGRMPEGIYVGPGPAGAPTSAVAGPNPAPATNDKQREVLMAAVKPMRVGDLAHRPTPAIDAPGPVEERVFGAKKFYSMTLNMPNLTSAGGSWVIRFAELRETGDTADLSAPVAELKVDPAYPAELRRARVEGMVTLYAIIHRDGTISDIRVLRGVDERLNENAKIALMKWRFRPGTKHGSAVDIEAVVQIPFLAPRF